MENSWRNLLPGLCRQRIVIEGTTENIVTPDQIADYLLKIASVTKMEVISGPYVYTAHEMGYGGWIHWKTSGCNFYSYPTSPALFTIDCYTCKPFSIGEAVDFTNNYFQPIDMVWKEVTV